MFICVEMVSVGLTDGTVYRSHLLDPRVVAFLEGGVALESCQVAVQSW